MTNSQLLDLLNQADKERLIALPGIGPALAERIVAARPFDSLEDCSARVRGVSAGFLQKLMAASDGNAFAAETTSAAVVDEALPSDDEEPSADEAAAAAPPTIPVDEWKQRFNEMKAQFETQMDEQARLARERIDGLSAELQKKSARQVTFSALIWSNLITLALALILAVAMISIASARLQRDVSATLNIAAQTLESVQTDVQTLQGRVDALEGIGDRTAALEDAQSALQEDFAQVENDVQAALSQLDAMQTTLDEQAQRTQRFDDFLNSLQGLLNQLLAEPLGDAQ